MEYFSMRWRWVLLFAILVPEIDSIQANSDVTESALVKIPSKTSNICGSQRIYKSIALINRLQGCRVIEGDLQILLIESKTGLKSEWKNYTFPDLVEITGYLLVFRVPGLPSLGQLFPNLTVIRGITTHMNYALIIWHAEHMRTLGLPKLTSILRGGVWIENNANLCTVDTDWTAITAGKDTGNVLKRNKFGCDPCTSSAACRLEHCSSGTRCQKKCNPECGNRGCTSNNECCLEECVGGCQTANESTYCTVCRHVKEGRFCTAKCNGHFYKYLGYRCVTDLECSETEGGYLHETSDGELECLLQCPLGYKEETKLGPEGRVIPQCKKCDGGVCDKTCPGRFIRNGRDAQALKGCTVIDGSLEISISGGKNISKTLVESLRNLKEVTGYIRIFRSRSFLSFDFLSSLVVIGGDRLYGDKYALYVHENENLERFWDWTSHVRFTIRKKNAKILFYSNPRLCYDEIRHVLSRVGQPETEESLVMTLTNGNKMSCQVMKMSLWVSPVDRRGVLKIQWFEVLDPDKDRLLGYYIYYKPRDGNARKDTSADDWIEKYVMADGIRKQTEGYLKDLEPNATYAIYIESDALTNTENASRVRSPIVYGKTVPFNPDSPSDLRVNRDFATVSWSPPPSPPPHQTNGGIDHYIVKVKTWPFPTVRGCEDYDAADHSLQDSLSTTTPSLAASNSTDTTQDPRDPFPSLLETRRQQLEKEAVFHDSLFNLVYRATEPQQQRYTSENSIWEYDVSSELDIEVPKVPKPLPTAYVNPDNVDQMSIKIFPTSGEWTMSTRSTNLTIPGLRPFTRYIVEVVACHAPEGNRVLCSLEAKTISFITPKKSTGGSSKVTDLAELKGAIAGRPRISWSPPHPLKGELVAYLITLRLQLPANHRSLKPYSRVFCISERDFRERNNTYEIEETNLEHGLYTIGVEAITNPPSPFNDTYAYVDVEVKKETIPTAFQTPTIMVGVLAACFIGSIILVVVIARVVYKRAPKGNGLDLTQKKDAIREDGSSSPTSKQLRTMFPDSQIQKKDNLRVSRLLGEGIFGIVYKGELRLPNVPASVPIACKKSKSSYCKDEILNEAKLMLKLKCHHLVKSYGIATKSSQVYLVMDLAQQDLLSFLKSLEPMDGNVFSSLDLQKVCAIAIQIADGMAYLAEHMIIHRDLAARNCLMFENYHVKISDFGLSRVTDNGCYYTKTTKCFPVRWLPPEYFMHNRFTCQSDVWSYGVVMWEIISKGALPYRGVSTRSVKDHVSNGNTLESEIVCQTPPFMSAMMTSCWNMDENRRPYFPQIVHTLYPHISPSFQTDFRKVSFYHTEEGQEYKRQVDWLRDAVRSDQDLSCDTQPPNLPARPSCQMKRFALLPTLVFSDTMPRRYSLETPVYENLLKARFGDDPSEVPQEAKSLLETTNAVDRELETGSVAGIGLAHIASPHDENRKTPTKSSSKMKWFASLPSLIFSTTMPRRYSLITPVHENVLKASAGDDPSEVQQEAQSLLETSNVVIDGESGTGSVAGTGSEHRLPSKLENRTTLSNSSFGYCSEILNSKSEFEGLYSSLESNEDTDDQVESTSVNLDLQRVRYSFTSTRNFPKCRPAKRSKSFSYHGVSSTNIKNGTS